MKKQLKVSFISICLVLLCCCTVEPAVSGGNQEKSLNNIELSDLQHQVPPHQQIFKNPYDPRFNPDNFRFEDYTISRCVRWEMLAKLFPKGTPKEFVDRVLINAGGASIKESIIQPKKYNYYIKLQPPKVFMTAVWNVAVYFSDDMEVLNITMGGGGLESVYDYYEYCTEKYSHEKGWNKK